MFGAEAATISAKPCGARAVAILLCFLVAMLEGFDIQAVGLVGKKLADIAHLGAAQLGLVFSMANAGLVVGAAAGGWLADRIGRKPVFVLSVVVFGVFTLATMTAVDYKSLLVVRALTGLGLGGAMPSMIAIAAELGGPKRGASTATTMFCGMPLGGAISSIFIANLPAHYDWRMIFVVGGITPLIVAMLIVLLMTGGEVNTSARFSGVGLAHALFGKGRALSTLLIWLAFFTTLMILYILLNWLPSFAADKGFAKPLEIRVMGFALALNASFTFNFVSIAGALALGRIVDRVGFRWPVIASYVGLFLSLIALAQAMDQAQLLSYAGIAGFFIVGAQYTLYGVAASYYPDLIRGVGSGFAVAVGRIGAMLGPVAAGELLALKWTANEVIFAVAPLAAIAAVAVFLLSLRGRVEDGA